MDLHSRPVSTHNSNNNTYNNHLISSSSLSRRSMPQNNSNVVGVLSFRSLLGILSCFMIMAMIMIYSAIPNSNNNNGIRSNSNGIKGQLMNEKGGSNNGGILSYFGGESTSLSTKVQAWITSSSSSPLNHNVNDNRNHDVDNAEPDWSREFWSPIEIAITSIHSDPMITLCKLDFKTYSQSPQVYPMNKDLITLSHCSGANVKYQKMSAILKEISDNSNNIENENGRVIEPTGFVFHESRVGSTLVANSLACDPFAMVYSESSPPSNVLLLKCGGGGGCNNVDRAKHVELFRNVIHIMGRSPIHRRLFFKFQSITSTQMEIALEAFPNTPWAFIYRQPVQTMMSHVDPNKGGSGAPCLRGMRNPYKEEKESIALANNVLQTSKTPKEAWCAARLKMLCTSALQAYAKHGVKSTSNNNSSSVSEVQRGLLVNYEALPGIVPRAILPMFGVKPSTRWLHKMAEVTSFYSKGRKANAGVFSGDSQKKDDGSNEIIRTYAKVLLSESFDKLERALEDGLTRLGIPLPANTSTQAIANTATVLRDWKSLKIVPMTAVHPSSVRGMGISGLVGAELIDEDASDAKSASIVEQPAKSLNNRKYLPDGSRYNHSIFEFDTEFKPWVPFTNNHQSRPFEVPDCPAKPPKGYPKAYNIKALTNNWLPDDTEIPPVHYDSLCHFDYQDPVDNAKAYAYRDAEVPFVLFNIPELDTVVKNWHNLDYLHEKLGKKSKFRTETSENNHFMYWTGGKSNAKYRNWKPPTGVASYTFEDWLEIAVKGQNKSIDERKHLYFRASGGGRDDSWVFKELPFFQPKKSLFMVSPRDQRGIHCRFGMRNVVSEAHFDGSRNFIAMIGGLRRWILTHPSQCEFMHMLPKQHPSGRHSEVDWSQPVNDTQFPNFQKVQANEVIMQAGDMLYLPTYWIHYIVQLNVNFQCNTRSGASSHFNADIRRCGF